MVVVSNRRLIPQTTVLNNALTQVPGGITHVDRITQPHRKRTRRIVLTLMIFDQSVMITGEYSA